MMKPKRFLLDPFATPKSVALLIYDQLCMFEFACATEVFGLPRPEMGPNWYRYQTVSIDGKSVVTQYNGAMIPNKAITEVDNIDLLIVAGWQGGLWYRDHPAPSFSAAFEYYASGVQGPVYLANLATQN
jgi:transcriptional regulator GlxA family with amidase domain